jgi:hypothetical protein
MSHFILCINLGDDLFKCAVVHLATFAISFFHFTDIRVQLQNASNCLPFRKAAVSCIAILIHHEDICHLFIVFLLGIFRRAPLFNLCVKTYGKTFY